MKILQIFSNWKWTGPAEHALNLAINLERAGHDVVFACAPPPEGQQESIVACARERGVEPFTGLRLNKHFSIIDNAHDIHRLRGYLKQEAFDIVHTHMPNDHLLAGMALRSTLSKTAIVRTCYDGAGLPGGFRSRVNFSLMTDALITACEQTKKWLAARGYLPEKKIWKIEVPVDIERFDPDRVSDCRRKFGLTPDAVVGGIVARVQTHRRFEVLLEALAIVLREFPGFKFMIIGRGTHIERLAVKPAQTMGIRTNLIFTGYMHEDYAATLACLDFKVFLVPGSDGSCRAVREAMAMGKPVIAARRGMLPEIVENETHGLIIDDTAENIAGAILTLVEDPAKRAELGRNARHKALACFDPRRQTTQVLEIYEKLLGRRAGPA